MSGGDTQAMLAAGYSQLAPMTVGPQSFFTPTFWEASNLVVPDETSVISPVREGVNFGGKCRFVLPKRATLVKDLLLEVNITAGVLAAANAAYVNHLGDNLIAQVTHRYGSHILHQYSGEYQQLFRRLTTNEVNEEGRNALTLGALPLTVGSNVTELQRHYAIINPITVYVPLDRLWFTQHMDESWMPEAYSTESEIEIEFNTLGRVIYNAANPGVNPFAAPGDQPTIESVRLHLREFTLTIPEKMSRLAYYETDRGLLTLFHDLERQERVVFQGQGSAATRTYRVRLDNIRLDMVELFFIVRRHSGAVATEAYLDDEWSGDPLQARVYNLGANPPTRVPSWLGGGANFSDVLIDDVVGFRLEANGKRLMDNRTELVNRAWHRKLYHLDSQTRDPIYFVSFALKPEDTKQTSGFQNAANLGNLELVIEMGDDPVTEARQVDVFVHSFNVMQSRRGDIVKSLR